MMRLIIVVLLLCNIVFTYAQYTIEGKILDQDGEPLIGANIVLEGTNAGTASGLNGDFSISGLVQGTYILKVSYMGFEDLEHEFDLNTNYTINLSLSSTHILGDEIIVSATRAGSSIPVAYTNVSKEEIGLCNLGQDIPYLLSMTPSLVSTSDAGTGIGYTGFRIRGTDANRINVTVNGIPINDAESHTVFWVNMPDFSSSLESVQVQRGVGTSTNGAAAFGATVNMQTNTLISKPYAEINSTFGSFNTFKNSVSAGTGLMNDRFSFDIRLSKINSDGYIDRATSDLKSFYLSGGYYSKNSVLKVNIFSGKEHTYQAWYGVPSYLLDSLRTYNPAGEYTDLDGNVKYYDNETDNYQQDHYQMFFSHRFTKSLSLNTALHYTYGRGYYEEFREDQSFSEYGLNDVNLGDSVISSTDLIRQKWLDNNFYGITFSMNYKEGRSDLTVGGAWNKYDGDHFGKVIWARYMSDGMKGHKWYDNNGVKWDFNVFAKYNFLLADGLNIYLDLQYRNIVHSIDGVDDDNRNITQSHSFDFINPKLGLFYELNDKHDIYFIFAVANREPNRSNYTDADPDGVQPKSERLSDFEFGYTYHYKSITAGINLYYMDYKDQLILTGEINDVGGAIMTNVEKSSRKGVELIFDWKISKMLNWNLNVTFSKSLINNFTEYVDDWDTWGQRSENLGTTKIAFSPQIIANSQLEFYPVKNLGIVLISNFVDKQYIDNTMNEDRALDSYFVNNLKVQYSIHTALIKDIEFHLLINNIANVKYESNAWVYSYYYNGEGEKLDGLFPQAGVHFLAGLSLRF